jgi:hypothetical protein
MTEPKTAQADTGNAGGDGLDAASQAAVDAFVEALWLEDGLADNSLQAYRRDLTQYLRWLQQAFPGCPWMLPPRNTCRPIWHTVWICAARPRRPTAA